MKDLSLTELGELDLDTGDLVLVVDSAQVAQHLITRLHLFYGEWIFDPTAGVKYIEEIFVKSPDISVVDGIIKATIYDTPGVIELVSYTSTFDESTREFVVECSYRDEYSSEIQNISEVLT